MCSRSPEIAVLHHHLERPFPPHDCPSWISFMHFEQLGQFGIWYRRYQILLRLETRIPALSLGLFAESLPFLESQFPHLWNWGTRESPYICRVSALEFSRLLLIPWVLGCHPLRKFILNSQMQASSPASFYWRCLWPIAVLHFPHSCFSFPTFLPSYKRHWEKLVCFTDYIYLWKWLPWWLSW